MAGHVKPMESSRQMLNHDNGTFYISQAYTVAPQSVGNLDITLKTALRFDPFPFPACLR